MEHDNQYSQVDLEKKTNINAASPEEKRSNTMEVVSLVLGISSIVASCCCGLGIILGAMAVIFALLSRGNQKLGGNAMAGLITGAIGIVVGIGTIIAFFVYAIILGESTMYSSYYGVFIQSVQHLGMIVRGGLG